MIDGLKPYPAMKDSGVPWLGPVPEHWEVRKLKFLVRFFGGGTPSKAKPEYWIGGIPWVSPKDMKRQTITDTTDHISERALKESAIKLIPPGAVLLVVRSGILRHSVPVAINQVSVALNQDMKALYPCAAIDARYLFSLIEGNQASLILEWTKQGTTVESVEHELLANTRFPLPPLHEQRAIVRFLDHADRLIRRYVSARRKLIRLLEELKQAIIHRAVTRGLDPDVRLRPSGVEWLGDIPTHWEVMRLRHCGSVVGGMTPSMSEPAFWGGDVPWVTPKDMKQEVIEDTNVKVTATALAQTALRLIPPGSVLMVVRGMILARRVPIALTSCPVTINQDMKAIVPVRDVLAAFLARLLSAAQGAFAPLIDEAGHGTKRFPAERWQDLLFAFPPRDEQARIVDFLGYATADVDKAIAAASSEIALLREYRTRLIADVVTGKLDVRAAAAALPEPDEAPDDVEAEAELPAEEDAEALGEGEDEGAAA